jgi:hypothetical protein
VHLPQLALDLRLAGDDALDPARDAKQVLDGGVIDAHRQHRRQLLRIRIGQSRERGHRHARHRLRIARHQVQLAAVARRERRDLEHVGMRGELREQLSAARTAQRESLTRREARGLVARTDAQDAAVGVSHAAAPHAW